MLIGAGSAMGPCSKLLECGANVVALDIPGAWGKGTARPATGVWTRLFGLAKASSGTLTYPKDANVRPASSRSPAFGCALRRRARAARAQRRTLTVGGGPR